MKKNIWKIMLVLIIVISTIDIIFTTSAEENPLNDNIPVYRAIFISPYHPEKKGFREGFSRLENVSVSHGYTNITKLYSTDEYDISKSDIENAIEDLAANDTEYDTSLIVIGTHGSQFGLQVAGSSTLLTWSELNENLSKLDSAIGLVINACHCGYALDNDSGLKVDGRVIITSAGYLGDAETYIDSYAKAIDDFADYGSDAGNNNGAISMKETYDYIKSNDDWGEDDSLFWSGYPFITQEEYYPMHITFQNYKGGRIDQITNRTWLSFSHIKIRKDEDSNISWQAAQEFKPSMDKISKIGIYLRVSSNNASSPIRVSIQEVGIDGKPNGTDLVYKDLPRSEFPDYPDKEYITFDFPDNYTVDSEKSYFIVFRTTQSEQGYYLIFTEDDCYPNNGSGYSCWSYENGNWTENEDKDLQFVSYGIDSNMPPGIPKRPGGVPNETYADVKYYFDITTTDVDMDNIRYICNWGDTWINTTSWKTSGNITQINHSWNEEGTYLIKVKAEDENLLVSDWSDVRIVNILANNRPDPPLIDGPVEQHSGKSYEYNFSFSDPDGDNMSLYIDWGDGETEEHGPFYNTTEQYQHEYSNEGTYTIKAKAIDFYGAESNWGYLEVTRSFNIFGYSSMGASSRSIKNIIAGSNFTVLGNGIADNITTFIQTNLSTTASTQCMIFCGSELIKLTEAKILNTGDEGSWVTYNFSEPKPELSKDTEYILACWSNDTCNLSYENTTGWLGRYKEDQTYGCTNGLNNITWTSDEQRVYSIFCRYSTTPGITNVSALPSTVGLGFNVTISVDIEDNACGMNGVTANVTYPDDSTSNLTMINTENNTFQLIFNNTWSVGQYNFTIWAEDKSGSVNSSSPCHFNVSSQATISVCTISDNYGSNEFINLTDPPSKLQLIGYELIDEDNVLHIWNKHNSYYFNTSSGIQMTNHYDEYWSHNVLMLGYYNNNQWSLIYCTNELSGFNKNIETDNETYVNATLWKDLSFQGYDFRLAIRYHLSLNDADLTVIPHIKNLGNEIPYTLGFGWEINDIKIADTYENDWIRTYNGTGWEEYQLNQTLDKQYTSMDKNTTFYLDGRNEGEYFRRSLYLKWNHTLDYLLRVKSRDGQYNAPVTLFIKIGTLAEDQEKSTLLHWLDSDKWLGISSSELDSYCGSGGGPVTLENALDGTFYWQHDATETHWFIIDLGETYTVKKVRGRSLTLTDPTDINVYVSDSKTSWGSAVASGISTWQDTPIWQEVDNTDKNGRYIKIEITATEDTRNSYIEFGTNPGPFTIFDIYGDIVEQTPTVTNPKPTNGATSISTSPTLNITVADPNGDNMIITWLSNSSGSWVAFGINNSVSNGTYHQIFTNASINTKWWYWKVNVTDGSNYAEEVIYKFYTGWESKINNTGSYHFKGYLLMQVQFYNETSMDWEVADDTINETSPRTLLWADPGGTPDQNILGLDTIFNDIVNTSNLSSFGNGTYRIYAAFRDPDGNVLVCNDETEMEATYEFNITF